LLKLQRFLNLVTFEKLLSLAFLGTLAVGLDQGHLESPEKDWNRPEKDVLWVPLKRV
jgi:hypothetical protein